MATNALVIEFGAAGKMDEEAFKKMQETLSILDSWKSDGLIEDHRVYSVVTGNRTERVAMLIVETSHEQLEALVVNPAYIKLFDTLESVATNITTNRAITAERLIQLAGEFLKGK